LPARGRFASLAKLACFLLNDFAGYLLQVRPLTLRSTLVAFDRYYHDLLVDPRRYRYGGSMRLARWVGACIPGPDLWVLLDAPAAVLRARKAEVALDEAARQRHAYLRLVNRWNADVVDASVDLDRVVAQADAAVLRFLEQRLESRHPELRPAENPLPSRLLQQLCRRNVPVLSRLFRIAFNCDIYCRIRAPLILPHPFGVIIHSRAVIGSHVTVMQQVTIGTKNPGDNAAPVIEDDVYIGAGAKVLGGIRVGRGAIIGANAVVTQDIPAGCTVVGANRIVRPPARAPGASVQGMRLAAGAAEPSRETMRA
jgi:serine acetyltransferase